MATLPVPVSAAQGFGIVEVDRNSRMIGFEEKPSTPKPMPGHPDRALSSMGNYLFKTEALLKALEEDARTDGSHDFGRDILPRLLRSDRVMAYNFQDNEVPGIAYYEEPGYWRDVGTIKAYWQANMDLLGDRPLCDLHNEEWPIRSELSSGPPRIGAKARLHRVIIDRQNEIPSGVELGYSERAQSPVVQWTASGLAVLPKPVAREGAAKRRLSPY